MVLGALLMGTWVLVGTRRTQGWGVLVLTHFLPKLLAGAGAKWGWARWQPLHTHLHCVLFPADKPANRLSLNDFVSLQM